MLINLRDKILSARGKTFFTKQELGLILTAYGERVQRGIWRDYAIDTAKDIAVFSIFKSTNEQPCYSVTKISSNKKNQASKYQLRNGDKIIKESFSLIEVVEFLREQK